MTGAVQKAKPCNLVASKDIHRQTAHDKEYTYHKWPKHTTGKCSAPKQTDMIDSYIQ